MAQAKLAMSRPVGFHAGIILSQSATIGHVYVDTSVVRSRLIRLPGAPKPPSQPSPTLRTRCGSSASSEGNPMACHLATMS